MAVCLCLNILHSIPVLKLWMIWAGNIFPSAILSVATTDAQVIVPSDSNYLGNPKSCIAVRVKSKTAYSRVRIEVAETPFSPVRCRNLY